MPIAIVVHGGAGDISPDRSEIVQEGCRDAVMIGWHMLQAGASALDAVEAAVCALENNPNYNAGTGSGLSLDGTIEMDAGIMEGHTLQAGGVAQIELIKNPVSLARKVLESPHALLVSRGARIFALEQGVALCEREDLLTERQYKTWLQTRMAVGQPPEEEPTFHRREVGTVQARHEQGPQQMPEQQPEEKNGTVGAVALDQFGNLAAATSTGGIPNKHPGRVGDSPLIGAGFYANEDAAISCTGYGEDFMRLLIAKHAADTVTRGMHAREAAETTIAYLGAKTGGTGGLIIVDRQGNVGFAWNSRNMSYAYITGDMLEPITGV